MIELELSYIENDEESYKEATGIDQDEYDEIVRELTFYYENINTKAKEIHKFCTSPDRFEIQKTNMIDYITNVSRSSDPIIKSLVKNKKEKLIYR